VRLLLFVLAGVVLVLAAVIVYRSVSARRSQAVPPKETASITLRSPRGELIDPPREFSWDPVPGATQYRVKIADEDAVWPMFVKTADRPPLVLESSELSAFAPGRIHMWEVEALGEDGSPIATGSIRFRITPIPAPS
jgi:hypothetical protein